jgi:hypothetical protein
MGLCFLSMNPQPAPGELILFLGLRTSNLIKAVCPYTTERDSCGKNYASRRMFFPAFICPGSVLHGMVRNFRALQREAMLTGSKSLHISGKISLAPIGEADYIKRLEARGERGYGQGTRLSNTSIHRKATVRVWTGFLGRQGRTPLS